MKSVLGSLIAVFLTFSLLGCASTRSASIPLASVAAKIAPALRKVAAQLESGVDPLAYRRGRVRADAHGRLQVYVHVAQVTDAEIASLAANGLTKIVPSPILRIVQGWVRPRDLDTLASLPFVTRITPPVYAVAQSEPAGG